MIRLLLSLWDKKPEKIKQKKDTDSFIYEVLEKQNEKNIT